MVINTFSMLQGVGVSLMLVQGMVGVNSLVVTSWMFVYFRDSFGTMTGSYTWTECQHTVPSFRELRRCGSGTAMNSSIEQTIPDYFAASVLQRTLPIYPPNFESWFGSLKFQVVFNLVVIWMIVFICLSKGNKNSLKVTLLVIFDRCVWATYPNRSIERLKSNPIFRPEIVRESCLRVWSCPDNLLRNIRYKSSWTFSSSVLSRLAL